MCLEVTEEQQTCADPYKKFLFFSVRALKQVKSTISAAQNSLLNMFTAVQAELIHALAKGRVKGEEATAEAPSRGV